MYYNLKSGKRVSVKFNHLYSENKRPVQTDCEVIVGDEAVLYYNAKCHPSDNFCKKKGRLESFKKCLNKINKDELLDKNERRELFNLVFPSFSQSTHNELSSDVLYNEIRKNLNKPVKNSLHVSIRQWFGNLFSNLSRM